MKDITTFLQGVFGDLYNPVMYTIKTVGIILVAIVLVKIGSVIIKKVFEKQKGFKYSIDSKRLDTMSSLMVSVFRYVTYIVAGIIILSDVFELKSVLAAAGIGGVAIGFGAQSLIKDMISGFFIVMEDQFVVGDNITIDNMTGVVEEMELRVTKIRHFNGDLFIIPNGEIKKVTNHTRGNKTVVVDVPIAYSADLNKAIELAQGVCEAVGLEFPSLIEKPKVHGITELGKDSLNMRITAKTVPAELWDIERRVRVLVKEEFSKAGIEFYDKNKIISQQA